MSLAHTPRRAVSNVAAAANDADAEEKRPLAAGRRRRRAQLDAPSARLVHASSRQRGAVATLDRRVAPASPSSSRLRLLLAARRRRARARRSASIAARRPPPPRFSQLPTVGALVFKFAAAECCRSSRHFVAAICLPGRVEARFSSPRSLAPPPPSSPPPSSPPSSFSSPPATKPRRH